MNKITNIGVGGRKEGDNNNYRGEGKRCRKKIQMQISLIDYLILYIVLCHQALCESHSCYHYLLSGDVVKFLQSYATETGLPMPAALHGRDNQLPIYLRAYDSALSVFKKYVDASNNCSSACKSVGLTLFRLIWNSCFRIFS